MTKEKAKEYCALLSNKFPDMCFHIREFKGVIFISAHGEDIGKFTTLICKSDIDDFISLKSANQT